jgi:hypothetical protein
MNVEQLSKLAWTERRLVNLFACKPIKSVAGQGLWPRAETKITCKVYTKASIKPAKVERVKLSRWKRSTITTPEVRTFDRATVASVNDKYVAMLAQLSAKHSMAQMVGEKRI